MSTLNNQIIIGLEYFRGEDIELEFLILVIVPFGH